MIDIGGDVGSIQDNTREEDDPESDGIVEEKATSSLHLGWRREQLEDEELGYFYDTAWSADSPISKKSTKLVSLL